ncbi:hypothetical protein GNZ01_06655 [Escherichia coli]|uniref:O-spanin n=4 Tax=root TaxID=1 RepID=A0AAJ2Y3U6_ECOLX|nr:hypothetical protein [Escherichia coli]YP_009150374.1 hypothetical protein ACQ29_gp060 [Escherichia phage PBECO4]WPK18245.1 hypothetical protein [Salmonella phage SD-2_S15]WPK18896.1 hypothetical protein [Salmonella phage SD-6_S16]WPK19563.1 hypothetical protein [Salmonella phage SD-1_S14]WPK20591.1 hypothetical protein [Salmonella phage SD-15_S21]SCA80388.1 hypothetical protein PSLUR01_00411 [Escherichia phage vB_Eco_slurp01]BBM62073.1 hypothetical protein EO157G_4840 [Escherichia phage 
MKKLLVPFISFLIISGCAEQVKLQSPAPIKQEILLERCDDDTPLPQKIMIDKNGFKGYDGAEILKVLTRWDAVYNECALKHDALIKTIRDLQGKDIKINIKE